MINEVIGIKYPILGEMYGKLNIPVIAAGGIATGRQMYASEILGASACQMGTVFLATDEWPVHDNYKKAIIEAKSDDITVTGYSMGMPVRLIKNEMANTYIKMEKNAVDKTDIENYAMGSLKKAVQEGDIVQGSVMAGLVVGQVNRIRKVSDVIEELMSEYNEVKNN